MSTGLSTGAIVGIVLAVIVPVATVITLAVTIPLVVYCCPGIFKWRIKFASRRNDEAHVAYSSKDDQQEVVMTGKYAFTLDYSTENVQDDLPEV